MSGNRKTKTKMPLKTVLMMLMLLWRISGLVEGETVLRLIGVFQDHGLGDFLTDKRHVEGLIRRGFIDERLKPTPTGLVAFGLFGSEQYVTIVSFLESFDETQEWQKAVIFEVRNGVFVPTEWAA